MLSAKKLMFWNIVAVGNQMWCRSRPLSVSFLHRTSKISMSSWLEQCGRSFLTLKENNAAICNLVSSIDEQTICTLIICCLIQCWSLANSHQFERLHILCLLLYTPALPMVLVQNQSSNETDLNSFKVEYIANLSNRS